MRKIVVLALILTVSLFVATANAITVKAFGSYGVHLTPDLGVDDPGLQFMGVAQTLYGDGKLKFGAEVGYQQIYHYRIEWLDGSYTDFDLYSLNALGIVQLDLMKISSVTPYIQAGAGIFRTSAEITDSDLGTLASESELDFGGTVGAGVSYELKEGLNSEFGAKVYVIMMEDTYLDLHFYAGVSKAF